MMAGRQVRPSPAWIQPSWPLQLVLITSPRRAAMPCCTVKRGAAAQPRCGSPRLVSRGERCPARRAPTPVWCSRERHPHPPPSTPTPTALSTHSTHLNLIFTTKQPVTPSHSLPQMQEQAPNTMGGVTPDEMARGRRPAASLRRPPAGCTYSARIKPLISFPAEYFDAV